MAESHRGTTIINSLEGWLDVSWSIVVTAVPAVQMLRMLAGTVVETVAGTVVETVSGTVVEMVAGTANGGGNCCRDGGGNCCEGDRKGDSGSTKDDARRCCGPHDRALWVA